MSPYDERKPLDYKYTTIKRIDDQGRITFSNLPDVGFFPSDKVKSVLTNFHVGQEVKFALSNTTPPKVIVMYAAQGTQEANEASLRYQAPFSLDSDSFIKCLPAAVQLVVASGCHENDINLMVRETAIVAAAFAQAAQKFAKGIPVVDGE